MYIYTHIHLYMHTYIHIVAGAFADSGKYSASQRSVIAAKILIQYALSISLLCVERERPHSSPVTLPKVLSTYSAFQCIHR